MKRWKCFLVFFRHGNYGNNDDFVASLIRRRNGCESVNSSIYQDDGMIEGEEEVGSENLAWFVNKNTKRLSCDVILISDTGMVGPGIPPTYQT